MPGLAAMVILAGAIATVLWFMADRIDQGKTQPRMGRRTQANTTPESWVRGSDAVADAMRMGARWYAGAAVVGIGIALFTLSASSGVSAIGTGLAIAAAPMVLGVIRAGNMLIPSEPTSSP